ncbi:MAG: hypothetical protein ACFB50_15420 [Rubrobacteraceae bacterium]
MNDTLHRLLPLLARVMAWLVVPLYAAGMFATFWFEQRLGLQDERPAEDVLIILGFGMFAVVGAVLVAKRPANLIGWIMSVVGLMVALFPAGDAYAAYVMSTSGQPNFLALLGAWVQSWYWYLLLALTLIYLPMLFPDGHLPSRRWLPIAVLVGLGLTGTVILGMLTDTLSGQNVDYEIENPIGIEGLAPVEDLPVFAVMGILYIIGTLGAVASVVVRYRRSRGIERQQLKWFLYAAAPILIIPVFDYLPDYVPGIIGGLLLGVVLVGLPTAIGLAVLRYRLYDIDRVINRTLVYGVLTIMLVAVYVGSIVLLQYLFRALTGSESQLAVVASTLAIAALFTPLRRRIQAFIDRRFYRRKYDAAQVLNAFGNKLRNETDLDRLNEELLTVVRETMQPEHVSLWMRKPEKDK